MMTRETRSLITMWENAGTLLEKYEIQQKAGECLNENQFDLFYENVRFVSIPTIHMGLNTSKSDGDLWDSKVNEVRKAVEEVGIASASWGCTGRTLHHILACQLQEALPEYDFDITYNYGCKIKKR